MPAFESIVNEGDFVAEHFLTSDGKASFATHVAARTKEWREQDQSPLTRFSASRGDIEKALIALADDGADDDASRALHRTYREVLGFAGTGFTVTEQPNVTLIASPGLDGPAPLAIVDAVPSGAFEDIRDKHRAGLWEPFEAADGTESSSLPGFVSALFAGEAAPAFVLVLAGRWALLTEAERWAEGRFIAVDLQLVTERNDAKRGGEIETALTVLAADSVAPDAEGDVWWSGVIEDSVKHTVGVSEDLREGVRRSIEIIANDVVTRRAQQGLDPLPQSQAQPLAMQSLRYLYRILFLLYAEASPELGVLPTGTPEYDAGYSLDRLRELVLGEITSHKAESATHLYDSLGVLFTLVDSGHQPASARTEDSDTDALTFRSLSADLFQPAAIALIGETKLSDVALKDVLERLLLSRKEGKQERGFISYAELGINQLGAVYEGLMSYTGFFAQDDLYEVAKNGDSSKGSWVVPTHRIEGIAAADFVRDKDPVTGEMTPVLHPAGTFVYRLAGRERQQSASFYTPEVLTRFTVRQALEELLDQDDHVTKAEEILGLTVCEPALGSGAFAIEAARQLADEYLIRIQRETGERIPPDEIQQERQRVKAYIALHNVYGVDLNGTAVELAEISLWLDTMVAGLEAPWFGLHLRRGNSLIGARRATYSRDTVNSRAWLTIPPTEVPVAEMLTNSADGRIAGEISGRIFHFLLPAEGWGAAADAREAKELAPDETAALKEWRKAIRRKPTRKQLDDLEELSYRAEALWQMAAKRLLIANQQARRSLDLWGRESDGAEAGVTRAQIEEFLADEDSAYRRLRAVMDAWCALWFWPVESEVAPPTLDEWIQTCFHLLGRAPEVRSRSRLSSDTLASSDDWDELGDSERRDLGFAGALSVADTRTRHPWLNAAQGQAADQGFFHWHLEFPQVFASGGFDLQVGNPPWVRPTADADALLAEGDPWWQLATKPSEAERQVKRAATLRLGRTRQLVLAGTSAAVCTAAYIGARVNFAVLEGLQPDLYRCFILTTWAHSARTGTTALIHPETHFADENAGELRALCYERMSAFWHFKNARGLFEMATDNTFAVAVYRGTPGAPLFDMATAIYDPSTIVRSLRHDGSGTEPGVKTDDGQWDSTPHRNRIVKVDSDTLREWREALEPSTVPPKSTRMLYAVNRSTARVLSKIASRPRVRDIEAEYSAGWHERNDRARGLFGLKWGPVQEWDDAILQGPNLFVANPFYKSPNASMKNKQDWTEVDLEALPAAATPTTSYKRLVPRDTFEARYDVFHAGRERPATDYYRVAWRCMARVDRERSLIASVIPPGTTHVDGVFSAALPTRPLRDLALLAGVFSSLMADFVFRANPKSTIRSGVANRVPVVESSHATASRIVLRCLRLNCLTEAYRALWDEAIPDRNVHDCWTARVPGAPALAEVPTHWTEDAPLRVAAARRQAALEIDALVALALGVTADELCTIYRTQFAVLRKYDKQNHYDANGRLVPNDVLKLYKTKGENLTAEERTATHPGSGVDYTYEFPFVVLDREADMREAYAKFEAEFGDDL